MPQKTVDEALIKRFSQVFRESGLTQFSFGKRIGLGQSGVGNILGGTQEPSKAAIRAIIREFDISPEWLISGTGDPRKGQEAPAGGPYVTEKAFEDVPGRLSRLEGDSRALLPLIQAVKDLDARVKELEKRLEPSE